MSRKILEGQVIATLVRPEALTGYSAAWAVEQCETTDLSVCSLTSLTGNRVCSPNQSSLKLWLGEPRGSVGELLDYCSGLLTPSELERARRFRRELDARIFLTAHAGLRLLLSDALACEPCDLLLGSGAHGKPTLDAVGGRPVPADVHFNLSHSGERVLIGIAAAPVGVDIETMQDFTDCASVARLAFSREAVAALNSRAGIEQMALFYRFWVLSESYIKATGLGIGQGLDTFSFSAAGAPRLTTATPGWGPPERWRFGLLAG